MAHEAEPRREPARSQPRTPPPADWDLDVSAVIGFVGGLILLLLGSAFFGALIYLHLRGELIAEEAPPPPLPAARAPAVPPAPRLQNAAALDMARLRARQEAELNSYGSKGGRAGVVQIPVERAMQLMVERGLDPALDEDPTLRDTPDGGAP